MIPVALLLKSGNQIFRVETCLFLKRVRKLGRGESIKEFRSVSMNLRLKINNMKIEKKQIKRIFFTIIILAKLNRIQNIDFYFKIEQYYSYRREVKICYL